MLQIMEIFFLFCYYGCLCFGGGSALTPIYIEDLVNNRHWMTLAEFGNFAAISQMTPGPIGVNLATFFGYQQAGVVGAAVATVGLLLVPYFLMMLAVKSLERWSSHWLVRGIIGGLKPATCGLISASLLIFLEMSVFTECIPWGILFGKGVSATFHIRWGAVLIFVISGYALYRTKVSIMSVIFVSALAGALLCRPL